MRQYPCSTTWPYLVLVGLAFIAAVKAPRLDPQAWRGQGDSWATVRPSQRQLAAAVIPQPAPPAALARTEASPPEDRRSPDEAPADAPRQAATRLIEPPGRPPVLESPAQKPPAARSATTEGTAEPVRPDNPTVGRRPVLENPLPDRATPRETRFVGERAAPAETQAPAVPPVPVPLPVSGSASLAGQTAGQVATAADDSPEAPTPDRPLPAADEEERAAQNEQLQPVPRTAYPALERLLASLAADGGALLGPWCAEVDQVLAAISADGEPEPWKHPQQVERLNQLLAEAGTLDPQLPPDNQRQTLRQLAYALRRRIDLWRQLVELSRAAPSEPVASGELAERIQAAEQAIAARRHAASWRQFLLLDSLRAALNHRQAASDLASQILDRWDTTPMTPEQARYLEDPALRRLRDALTTWAADPEVIGRFCRAIERFEIDPSAAHAGELTRQSRLVAYTYGERSGELGWWFEQHYRNANVRLAVSEELIRRIMPALQTYAEQVEDFILGARVLGQNRSWTQLEVETVPDPRRWHLVLRAKGEVRSHTASTKGPVTFFNQGQSTFEADKHLLADANGIFVTHAQVAADASSLQLTGLRTDYDAIPLFGWLVRQYALQQHQEHRPDVRREMRNRVATSASTRMDREVHQRLDRLESRLDQRILTPLRSVGIEPALLEMQTTDQRLIARGRLAAACQPAGFTARPQALHDSLLSLQVHQSAWNNLVQRLELEGQEVRVLELIERIGRKLDVPVEELVDELPEDVTVRFADERPLEVTLDDGYILLTLRFAQLSSQSRDWRDFVVKAYYRLDASRLEVELIRDGGIQLICPELGFRDRLAVRSIFTKVLARHRRLGILHDRLVHSPRLANLAVTQLEVDHGWLGISLGLRPQETAAARTSSRR